MSETNQVDEVPIYQEHDGSDLTRGPILRTLVAFSIPTLGTNVLQTLGMTINAIWVGQLLGASALAATANANTISFLGFATFWGFSMATTVKMGLHFGAKEVDSARSAFGSGTGFSVAMATIGAILGWIFADQLLDLLATPDAIRSEARAYLRVSFLALPLSTISTMVSQGLRANGDAKTPLYAMVSTTLGSVILNPLLIRGIGPIPALGIAGSALSLALANAIGILVMIVWIYWRDLPIRLRGAEIAYLIPRPSELGYIIGKGFPMGAQMALNSAATLIMVGLVNREGMLTVAAYGAILQLWSYIQMPSFAISTAVSAMVAQNIGAGQHDRVAQITMTGLGVNGLVTSSLFLFVVAIDGFILPLFLGAGNSAVPIAEHIQLMASWSWVFQGMMMIMVGTMRGYGVVLVPLIVMTFALYPVRLGFYFLAYPTLGPDGLWLSYGFSAAVALGLTWLAYSRGAWRRRFGLGPALAEAD